MAWVKIDDQMPHHKKFLAVSPTAGWLWVCGLAYANNHRTDGMIPARALASVAPTIVRPLRYVEELVRVRLWERRDDEEGWRIHDYHEYQPSGPAAAAKAAARAEAGRRGGLRSGEVRRSNGEANGKQIASGVLEANAKQPTNPVPVPVPVPVPDPEPVPELREAGKQLARSRRSRADTNPAIARMIRAHAERFEAKYGAKLTVAGGKDGETYKRLLATYGEAKLLDLLELFFGSADPFIVQSGHSIGVFASVVNKVIAQGHAPLLSPKTAGNIAAARAFVEGMDRDRR